MKKLSNVLLLIDTIVLAIFLILGIYTVYKMDGVRNVKGGVK